jgi:hypothetical protein
MSSRTNGTSHTSSTNNNGIQTVIEVTIVNQYGQERIYPQNELGRNIAAFARVKTFTRAQVDKLKEIGYTIEQVIEKVEL